jgi:kynurenine formamidase
MLVRLGSGAMWDDRAAYEAAGGVSGEASAWLAEQRPLAVGADNIAWDAGTEPDPVTGTTLPGHVLLLVRAGIHIIESLYLEELAADGVREFAFCCLPLKLRGGTGSPVRPIALV